MSVRNTRRQRTVTKAFLFLSVFLLAVLDIQVVGAQNPRADFFNLNDIIYYDDTHQACVVRAGSDGSPTSTVPTDFTLGPLNNAETRQVALMQALIADYDLSPAQAAGIVGNFMHESAGTATAARRLPPDVNQGDTTGAPPKFSGGYGWAQWTGPRQRTFINFAVQNGYMASDRVRATDAANYAYLRHELDSTAYASTITELRKQTTPEAAAISFEATFEKAGVPALDKRTAGARAAYEAFTGGSGATTIGTGAACGAPVGSAGIVGDVAFPLLGTKKVVKNPGMFRDGTADRGGHPYIAYDILADPGTPVAAFMSGRVTRISSDRCPGRLIGIYNEEADVIVSYLHLAMNNHVAAGTTVKAGDRIGVVGSSANGCGTPHLHIDVAQGSSRPGCSRLSCPAQNANRFVDIGRQLYETYQALPN
jgi:murein DD-endopeptidase MepM/ murein hydrolase activator NlpD